MRFVRITNITKPNKLPIRTEVCESFLSRFRGLMFRKSMNEDEGLLFIETRESRTDSSIHMLFMRFDIAVVWLNRNYRIVDVQIAKKWRPAYVPSQPAKYILEIHPARFHDFQVGDQLNLEAL